jgi:lipoprotein-releasing system permease protein
MIAIAVSSAAMIIIFSVFNGLESIAKQGYVAFYPDIKVTIAKGKFFPVDSEKIRKIEMTQHVDDISAVIEDYAFAVHYNEQKPVILKGIDDRYMSVNDVSPYIIQGDTFVMASQPQGETNPGNPNTAILGSRILNELGTDINSLSYFTLNAPDASITDPGADPLSALRSVKVRPAGVFRIQDDFDSKYILAPFGLVQELFNQPGKCTSIEIKVKAGKDKEVQEELKKLFGDGYKVETRYEQNKTMYMAMGAEKWVMYAILMMVMLIASFNMIGALSMLVLEKQKDIAILKAMGALPGAIKRVFLLEGILWALMGGVTGLSIGIIVCLLQQKFELIQMGESFIVSAFPVEIHGADIVLVFATVMAVGLLIAWYPAIRATKVVDPTLKSA